MKSVPRALQVALLTSSFAAGCGLENSLVGGRCSDGMILADNACVPAPALAASAPAPSSEPRPARRPLEAVRLPPLVPVATAEPSTPPPPVPPPLPTEPPPPPLPPPLPLPPPTCTPPLVACHGACIAVTSDPRNCGACAKICPANICVAGECQGATPGDVVLIGHDFAGADPGSSPVKVLVNALSIPTSDPIRVLSYEDDADPARTAATEALATSGIRGRGITFTRAASGAALLSDTLGLSYDVVLVHEARATPSDAAALGATWASPLGRFTQKGGVVIALDRGASAVPALLTSAGLLTVTSHAQLPSSTFLLVTSAGDVVGAQVLSPYAAFGAPVSFQGLPAVSSDLDWVVRARNGDGSPGDAVVVHRVVRDGG
jgi:ferredoxin